MGKNKLIKRKRQVIPTGKEKRDNVQEKIAQRNMVAGMNKLHEREKLTFCIFSLIYDSSFPIISSKSCIVSHSIS